MTPTDARTLTHERTRLSVGLGLLRPRPSLLPTEAHNASAHATALGPLWLDAVESVDAVVDGTAALGASGGAPLRRLIGDRRSSGIITVHLGR